MAAPGTTIEERGGLALSVQTSPTVPVLIGIYFGADGVRVPMARGCVRVETWLDYVEKFSAASTSMVANLTSTPDALKASYQHELDSINVDPYSRGPVALRHYFENGGGPCYVLPYAAAADYPGWTQQIQNAGPESGISLIAHIDKPYQMGGAYEGLAPLLEGASPCFLITSSTDPGGRVTSRPELDPAMQAAFYHPFLKIPYRYWRDDATMVVTGYKDSEDDSGATIFLAELAQRNPALYKKIVQKTDERIAEIGDIELPPSAAVAAAYCRTHRERGIWKAPANVTLVNAVPALLVSDAEHGDLNDQGVNVIRYFSGQGAVIYGARTMDVAQTDWRYVPVRRLFNQVERDVTDAMKFAVYEPNTAATWVRVKSAIESYLHGLWQQGGLKGAKPEEGYVVAVGESTMTPEEIVEGTMIVRIGLAVVRPAEFIILQFTQNMA